MRTSALVAALVAAGCTMSDSNATGGTSPGSGAAARPSRPDDEVQNGDETDVDCGGTTKGTPRCAAGKECAVNGDCASTSTISGSPGQHPDDRDVTWSRNGAWEGHEIPFASENDP